MENESLFSPLAEMSSDQFMEYSERRLQTLVASAIVPRFKVSETVLPNSILTDVVEDQDISEYLEREREFMVAVLEAYGRWSLDVDNVVLWDVDETMGKVAFVPNMEPVWHFRPAMQLLIPYLSIKYPEIKNGILTTRTVDGAMSGFEVYSDLLSRFPFFDTTHIYSVREVAISNGVPFTPSEENKEDLLYEALVERTQLPLDSATMLKYKVLQVLRTHNPDKHFRVIDDNAIADIEGENGLCVYYMQPNIW
ncbi:MAG TPA: hypothetical protein PLT50_03400 [bacterium]|nr:hypothetical protein [bacterium]